jgi:hypothetical protein
VPHVKAGGVLVRHEADGDEAGNRILDLEERELDLDGVLFEMGQVILL